jgi:hypothetical protein
VVAYTLVEDALCGRDASEPCADFLVLGPWAVGVVDGSSPKPGVSSRGVGGEVVARTVAAELESLCEDVTLEEVVTLVSQAAARLGDNGALDFGARACATFAVLHAPSRQVWRVGDPTVLVGGKIVPQRPRKGELIVARARALVLRERLLAGASVEQLRAHDLGREAVSELLVGLDRFRNNEEAGDFGYGAIDGGTVPSVFVERFDLPPSECHVVIATDGYTEVMPSLGETEALLAQRLRADPLLIEEPPQTKGVSLSSRSFDDRAYVHLKV